MEFYSQTAVAVDELRKTANTLEDIAGEYARSLKILYNHVEELGSMWGDSLNRRFLARFESEKPYLENMAAVLSEYAEALRDNARIYDDAEGDVMEILGRPVL